MRNKLNYRILDSCPWPYLVQTRYTTKRQLDYYVEDDVDRWKEATVAEAGIHHFISLHRF